MTTQQYINVIGLTIDIFGVIMLFIYGLPSEINKEGNGFLIIEESNKEEKELWKRYNRRSKIALSLIILGFILQVISTCWSSF